MTAPYGPGIGPQFSADGRWWWDGKVWVPAEQATGVAEAFGDGPPLPPLEPAETAKILLFDQWGTLRLLLAHVTGKTAVKGWSGEPRAVTSDMRWMVFAMVALPLGLFMLVDGVIVLVRSF